MGEKASRFRQDYEGRMSIARRLREEDKRIQQIPGYDDRYARIIGLFTLEKMENELGEDLTSLRALGDLIDPICSLVCEKVPVDSCEDETEEMWYCTSCGVDLPEVNGSLNIPSSQMDMSCLCMRYCPECGSRIVSMQPLEEDDGSD